MPTYFLDTSALVKRHVAEPGHTWVDALCDPLSGNTITVSEAAIVEVVATFYRMARETPPRLSVVDRDWLITYFQTLLQNEYAIVEVKRAIFTRAAALCRTHPLRAYDAMQLACALTKRDDDVAAGLPAPTFVCADITLLAAAASEGLPIENPTMRP